MLWLVSCCDYFAAEKRRGDVILDLPPDPV